MLAEKLISIKTIRQGLFELCLIIVGILIALQIDNWNDHRIDRQNEVILLEEIKTSIKHDLDRIERAFHLRLDIKEEALERLYQLINDKAQLTDEEFMNNYISGLTKGNISYTGIGHDFYMRYDSGPYESLKNSGLQLISSQELRSKLIDHYENDLPSQTYFINAEMEHNRERLEILRGKLFKLDRIEFIEGKPANKYLPRVENILFTEDFWELLELERRKAWNQRGRLDGVIKDYEELLELVEEELARIK